MELMQTKKLTKEAAFKEVEQEFKPQLQQLGRYCTVRQVNVIRSNVFMNKCYLSMNTVYLIKSSSWNVFIKIY